MSRSRSGPQRGIVNLVGLVLPSSWDSAGNITNILLSSDNETEYEVLNDDKKRELLYFIHKRIRASGSIDTDPKGRKRFRIINYSVLRS